MVWDDDPCPQRSGDLKHIRGDDGKCPFCGAQTLKADHRQTPPPLVMALVRETSHSPDSRTGFMHPGSMFGGHIPHRHTIREDWSFDEKQIAGAHIDRWHRPA